MAVPWTPLYQNFPDHPKIQALARALDCHEDTAIAKVVRLWTWALTNAPDGDLGPHSDRVIARACTWEGDASRYVTALHEVALLRDGRVIANWEKYGGKAAATKSAGAERQRKYRERQKGKKKASRNKRVTSPSRNGDALDKIREEKNINPPTPLDTKRFRDAWSEYETYRREAGHRKLQERSVAKRLAEMAEWGEEQAIEAIRQSIASGYQGIFRPNPPKPDGNGKVQAKKPKPRTALDANFVDMTQDHFEDDDAP